MDKKSAELFPNTEINSPYYLLKAIKLFSLIPENNSFTTIEEIQELITKAKINEEKYRSTGDILARDSLRRVAFYAIDYGAVSIDILRHRLGLSEVTAWRTMNHLCEAGILYPSLMIARPRGKKGGRKVKLFQTADAMPEQVKEALELQARLESPKYLQAVQVAQAMIEDYPSIRVNGEVRYSEVLEAVKNRKLRLNVSDVASLVSKDLTEEGIRVWR